MVDGDVGPGQAFAEDMDLAVGITDSQGALADEALKQIGQQTHVAVLRGAASFCSNGSERGHGRRGRSSAERSHGIELCTIKVRFGASTNLEFGPE